MDRKSLLHNQSARSAVVDVVMSALEARDFVTEDILIAYRICPLPLPVSWIGQKAA